MRIISRYVVNQFFIALLTSLLAFIVVFLTVDIVENIDNFIDRGISTPKVVLYYIYYIPYILVLVFPISMLLACLFSLGRLARNNEIVAMKSAGISLYRILFPVFRVSLLLSVFIMVFSEIVVPETNQRKTSIKRPDLTVTMGGNRINIFLQDIGNQIVYVRYYDAQEKSGRDVSVQKYKGISLINRIDAKYMKWKGDIWEFREAKVRQFTGEREILSSYDRLPATMLTLLPSDFAHQQKNPLTEMGFLELKNYIERVKKTGEDATRWIVDLYLKTSFPFSNFIIVLFGAPLAASIRKTGRTTSFGVALIIGFLYYGLIKAGQALGWHETLSPIVAAWLSNILFGLVGLGILLKAQK